MRGTRQIRATAVALAAASVLGATLCAGASAYPMSANRIAVPTGDQPLDVVGADFDGDGKTDLATANQAGTVTLLSGDGDAGFAPLATAVINAGGFSAAPQLAAGDLNSDGRSDLAIADSTQGLYTLLSTEGQGSAGGGFDLIAHAAFSTPNYVTAGDFVAGGGTDIAIGYSGEEYVRVLAADSAGGLTLHAGRATPVVDDGNPNTYEVGALKLSRLATANLDGQGRDEVVYTGTQLRQGAIINPTYIHAFTEAGQALADFGTPAGGGIPPPRLAVAPGTGGRDDVHLLTFRRNGQQFMSRYTSNGTGLQSAGTTNVSGLGNGVDIAAADFDGDGVGDPAVLDGPGGLIYLYPSTGGVVTAATGAGAVAIATGDFDSDQRSDVVTADRDDDTASVRRHAQVGPLASLPMSVNFAARRVDAGASATSTATVTNPEGSPEGPVAFSAIALGGPDAGQFELLGGESGDCAASTVLAPGQSCAVRTRFDPGSTGTKTASVTVRSNGPVLTIPLSGRGQLHRLALTPSGGQDFGSVDMDVGPSAALATTVQNTGDDPVTLDQIGISGTGAGQFALSPADGDCAEDLELAVGAQCTVHAAFDPSTTGPADAELTVTSDEAPALTRELAGTGVRATVAGDPGSLTFATRDIDDGASAPQSVTVENDGDGAIDIQGVAVGTGFTRLTGDASDCGGGTSLDEGDTCTVRVAFDPAAGGPHTGAATVTAKPVGYAKALTVTTSLSGSATESAMSAGPAALVFDSRDTADGPSPAQTVTVRNDGTQGLELDQIAIAAPFTRGGGDCVDGGTIAAGSTCTVGVAYDPGSAGDHAGALRIEATSNGRAVDASTTLAGRAFTRPPASAGGPGTPFPTAPTAPGAPGGPPRPTPSSRR